MKKQKTRAICGLFAFLMLVGCSKSKTDTAPDIPLKDAYANYFSIGAAINDLNMTSPLVTKHFNSVTSENHMKWSQVHPAEGTYDYTNADKFVSFAQSNGLKMRGHALVWHEAVDNWVFKDSGEDRSKEDVLNIEIDHIRNVVTHFGDKLYCWDVANEVIDDNTTALKEDKSNIYRDSNWYKTCGRDFILTAYKTADAILRELGIRDKVKLFYNDYGNTSKVKLDKTVEMLKWLKNEDPKIIDGIGLQCHYHLGTFNVDELRSAINTYSDLGLDVQITEFDCEIYDNNIADQPNYAYFDEVPNEVKQYHAAVYDRAFEVFRDLKDKISNVTFWGVSDRVCYMNNNKNFKHLTNFPFIFDTSDKPKAQYYDLVEFNKSRSERYYQPYSSDTREIKNKYPENGADFHVGSFYEDTSNAITTPEFDAAEQAYKVTYSKAFGKEYANINANLQGHLADFTYLNILSKGEPGKSLSARMYFGDAEDDNHNVFGNDTSFALTSDYAIHSLKFKGTLKTRADLAKTIALFPEIGIGAGASGVFYFKDIWFSKTLPDGAVLENPGVDSGDTTVRVNGWATQAWTNYVLYNAGNGHTGVSYKKAAEWAYIEKTVDIKDTDNMCSFTFENQLENNKLSITSLKLMLRGDVSRHVSEGVEYEYDEYYGDVFYSYNPAREGEFQPDPSTGLVTINASIVNVLEQIGTHHKNGYRLVLLIESHPDDYALYKRYAGGKMVIHSAMFSQAIIQIDPYSQYGNSSYVLTKEDGIDRNVTYTDLVGSSYWPRLVRKVETNRNSTIEIKLKNNTSNEVQVGVHAGIFSDDRSDAQNNMFYPLWNTNTPEESPVLDPAKNGSGYYTDGATYTLPGDDVLVITITCDEKVNISDSIDCIQFLFDNCRPGDIDKYSGDIDIVYVDVK